MLEGPIAGATAWKVTLPPGSKGMSLVYETPIRTPMFPVGVGKPGLAETTISQVVIVPWVTGVGFVYRAIPPTGLFALTMMVGMFMYVSTGLNEAVPLNAHLV